LGYHFIVFKWQKKNYFNGLKSSDNVLRWLLLLWKYGVTLKYFPGKENIAVFLEALSCLDIDIPKIDDDKKEVLKILSVSENSSIRNIKLTIPMRKALKFKDETKFKELGLRNKS
jgi:hypothetical protein